MAIIRKTANFGKNGEFKSLAKYKRHDKKGHLDKRQFYEITNLAKIYKSLAKNVSRMTKETCR